MYHVPVYTTLRLTCNCSIQKKNYFNYDADDDDETPLQNMFFLKCCLLDSLTQTVSLSLSTTTHIIYLQFLNKIKDCILYSQKQMQIYLCVLYTI